VIPKSHIDSNSGYFHCYSKLRKPEELIPHGDISGVVKSSVTSEPISSATVILEEAGDTAVSDSDGSYLLRNLKPGGV
jgi:hypothetical protein